MTERYISVTDDEYVYFLDTESEDYKTLEDFEKKEFETAKKDNIDIEEYEDAILLSASDKYWDYVYNYHVEADTVCDLLNEQEEEIRKLTCEIVRLRLEPQLKQNKKSIKDAVEVNNFLKEQDKTIKELEETIQELYDFRLIYNALLFNEWSKHDTIEVYKSKKHSDGELCFDGEWFVVVAILPTGQITNHYHINYWDYFQIKEYPQVKDEFDEHTLIDVLNRLKSMVMWNDNQTM